MNLPVSLRRCLPAALACAALLAGSGASQAQTPATSRSVALDATESAGDSTTLDRWRTSAGSNSRTKAVSRQLTISVRNMSGSLPGEFEIEWYFVGKPASGIRRFLYDKGTKRVTLKPGTFEKVTVTSKELSNYKYTSVYSGYTYRSGDRADGWIIRAKVGDDVVRVKASNATLEQLEKNPEEFGKFVQNVKKVE